MNSATAVKFVGLLMIGALAVGCGGDDTLALADGTNVQRVTVEGAGDDVELVEYTSSAMGGLRFSVDPAHHVYTRGDSVVVSISDPNGEAAWEAASIGLLTQTADGIAIESVDQILDLVAAEPSAAVTPTETAIELLGYNLAGYDISAEASANETWILSADRVGSPAISQFGFTPHARIFLAQTPAGVLVAGSSEADDPGSIEAIDVALGTLLSTIELTGDGIDAPLPPGQTLEPDEIVESSARGDLAPDGPAALDAPFSPIEPGTYQLANFGPTFTVEFTADWFVQPNFPGFIILTSPSSGGPGDRDVVFATGVVDLMRVAPGPVPFGEPVLVASVDEVIEILGEGLEVTGVEEVDLDGLAATRFDVRIPNDSLCTADDPCEYVFRTSWGFVKKLSPTHMHRIWWIDDGAEGPSMIIAMAPFDDDFMDSATELIDTLVFTAPSAGE